jgi:hypothetical protein
MNSDLTRYLNKYFTGATGVYENNQVDLVTHFREKFGVIVKMEDGLFQFKYDQLEAKFSFPLVKECRGHILAFNGSEWFYVSRPQDKFFNQHEGYCPIFQDKDFNSLINQLAFVEKIDGSCIQVFYDPFKKTWRATTLGAITAFKVGEYDITFSQLFWKTLCSSPEVFEAETGANKAYTYIFELACMENRVVTQYPKNFVALLAIRNKETGEYESKYAQEQFVITFYERTRQCDTVRLPYIKFMYEVDIKCLEDAKKWIENESNDTSKYGNYAEGFVIYNGCYPIAKMKNMRYLQLHSVGGGDVKHSINASIDAFFCETIDDIYGVLPEPTKVFIESLRNKVIQESKTVIDSINQNFAGKTFETQKDYALCVLKTVDKKYSGFFFGNKEKILNAKADHVDLFKFWLKSNYQKFDWKKEIKGE